MLTLTRKIGESIRIGDNIIVVVKEIKGKQVRIGIEAPRDVYVCREELFMKIKQANQGALAPDAVVTTSGNTDALTTLGRLLLSRQAPVPQSGKKETESQVNASSATATPHLSRSQDHKQAQEGDE